MCLRLKDDFIPALMRAARRGLLVMLVSNTSFVPAFKRALVTLGFQREHIDRIVVAAGTDRVAARLALAGADFVYVSPLCHPRLRTLASPGVHFLDFEERPESESIVALEASLLVSSLDRNPLKAGEARTLQGRHSA